MICGGEIIEKKIYIFETRKNIYNQVKNIITEYITNKKDG